MSMYTALEHQGLAVDFLNKCKNEDFATLLKNAQSVQKLYPDNQISWYDTFKFIELKKVPDSPLHYSFVRDCCTDDNIFAVSEAEKKSAEAHEARKQELKKLLHEHGLN